MTVTPFPAQPPAQAAPAQSALRTLELERCGIAALELELASSAPDGLAAHFARAVELIRSRTGRVIVSGMGKSGHIARKIAATLASTGSPAYFVHPGEASHGDLGMIKTSDALLLLSWSGETKELADIITYSRRHEIGLIAVTSGADSTLAAKADVTLLLPKAEEACPNGLAPTTSTIMQLAIGDALAVALLEARGFTAADFRNFHPGGKLGASLTFVRDIMHTGQAMPLIGNSASMGEAIVEISAKGFGCVGVLSGDGKLEGIVTDGDLRRHMRPDLTTLTVGNVMTPDPKTISGDALAVEALNILNSRKYGSVLFVTGAGGELLGIVHLHDLLRLGLA
ncbi:MAG: SIS domain-containing protein [Beijerinckiaceae bacterium]